MKVIKHISLLICACSLTLGCKSKVPDAQGNLTMRPTTSYLHLLRHTPFFTSLTDTQLKFVIDNSKEWAVDKGGVISQCNGDMSVNDSFWILLDGQWALTYQQSSYLSAKNTSGKWYQINTLKSAGIVPQKACTLVMHESGYVMKITEETMTQMRNKNFDFTSHLQDGAQHYGAIAKGNL